MSNNSFGDVTDDFTYHPPSAEGVAVHNTLSNMFIDICNEIDDLCPAGREKQIVKTKLEEAKFWASAAVARNKYTR